MASPVPEIIFEFLPGPNPAGQPMKHHHAMDELRNLLLQENDTKWREIKTVCIDILSHQSKDFSIFVRLIDALAHGSFTNLVSALEVYVRILENFWGVAHPKEQMDTTIVWLDDALRKQCMKYQMSSELTVGQGLAYVARNHNVPHSGEYNARLAQVPNALLLCQRINGFIVKNEPDFPKLKELEKVLNWLSQFMEAPKIKTQAQDHVAAASNIMSRSKAYDMLKEICEYLGAQEPHSIVPPLLKLLYSWRNASLSDIISELKDINDGAPDVVWELIRRKS